MAMRPTIIMGLTLLLAACGGKQEGPQRQAPLVEARPAVQRVFIDRIEAVGTARANEQVTLSAPVTERITRLNFEDGGYVARGQVIAELARNQESATLAGAQAQAREANQQLARLQELKQRGFATNARLDEQVARTLAARAQAGEAQAQIADRVIRAPFSGYASLRTISAGAVVNQGTPIATISDISRIKLDFTVPETMLTSIRQGQPIEARAAAFPGEPFRGTIATVDPVIDPTTRAVAVRAILPNPGNRLKPGMLLSVSIQSASRTGLAVPELAVIGEGEERFVYVVGPGNKAVRVPVRVGTRDGGMVEILSGLRPDQRVIGDGVVKVNEGTVVRVAGEGGAGGDAGAGGPPAARQGG